MNKSILSNVGIAMRRNFDMTRVAGSQILVIHNGEVQYEDTAGYMDIEDGKPAAKDAIYRVYSMTKPITMAAIMRLVEKGLIFLEDPLYEYIPEFKDMPVAIDSANGAEYVPQRPPITIKNLLTMTSGLSYPGEEDWGARSMAKLESEILYSETPTLEVAKAVAKNVCLSFQPGERFKYGFSHDVVGAVIEVVSGMRLGEYLKKEIFEPLDMTDTAFWVEPDKASRFAHAYTVEDGKFKRLMDKGYNDKYLSDCAYESGGGGLTSTAMDYAKFCLAMRNGTSPDGYRLLSPKTVNMMATNQLNDRQMETYGWAERGYGYGLGLRVCLKPWIINGTVGEFGWDGMMGTFMAIDPVEDMVMVYMQNMFPHSMAGFKLLPIIYAAIE